MASKITTTVKNTDSNEGFCVEELLEVYQKLNSSSVDLFKLFNLQFPATAGELGRAYDNFLQKFNVILFSYSTNEELVEKANYVFDEVSEIFDTLIIGFNLIDINDPEVN